MTTRGYYGSFHIGFYWIRDETIQFSKCPMILKMKSGAWTQDSGTNSSAWCIKDILPGQATLKPNIPQALQKTFSGARDQMGLEMAPTG